MDVFTNNIFRILYAANHVLGVFFQNLKHGGVFKNTCVQGQIDYSVIGRLYYGLYVVNGRERKST